MSSALAHLFANATLTTGEHVAPPQSVRSAGKAFPALSAGHIHEWYPPGHGHTWHPPLTLLAMLATRCEGHLLWIGRRNWPAFQLLTAFGDAMKRSTFLDPLTDEERFFAIAEGLRCPGVGCVVADGSGMSATTSRRLQLAAESGSALGLITRPGCDLNEPSYAATRWHVRPYPSATGSPRWEIELMRCRGQRPEQDAPRRWIVDWTYRVFVGSGALHFSSDVGHGCSAPEVSKIA